MGVSKSKKQKSRRGGFALLSLIVLGAFSLALMMAIAQNIQSIYNSEQSRKYGSELRCAAESGVEYAIGDLGKSSLLGTASSLDPIVGQSVKTTILPNTFLSGTSGGRNNSGFSNHLTLTLTVRRFDTTSSDFSELKKWSSIYSSNLDSSLLLPTAFDKPSQTNVQELLWRVVECTAKLDSGGSKSVRAVLEPVFDLPTGTDFLPPGTSSYFPFGAFGNSRLSIGSDVELYRKPTDSEFAGTSPNRYNLTVASNKQLLLSSGISVRGDASVLNFGPGSGNLADQVARASGAKIAGRLSVNDNPTLSQIKATTSQDFPDMTPSNPDNVLADSDLSHLGDDPYNYNTLGDPRQGVNRSSPVNLDAKADQYGAPPSQTGRDAQPLPDLSDVANTTGSLFSSTGDWSTGSLSTDSLSSGSINVSTKFGSSDGSPVRIFVDDSSTTGGSTAVSLNAAKFVNTSSPSSLQIWYSGTRAINIETANGKDFAATIYAPFAKVNFTGNGNFIGAVTGSEVTFGNSGTNKLLNDFTSSVAGPTLNQGLQYASDLNNNKNLLPTGYRVVTWQEL